VPSLITIIARRPSGWESKRRKPSIISTKGLKGLALARLSGGLTPWAIFQIVREFASHFERPLVNVSIITRPARLIADELRMASCFD
jgi:hypothetical protein